MSKDTSRENFLAAALTLTALLTVAAAARAADAPRARDLGVPFDGTPGRWNAITDVPGVAVGLTTLIEGEPPLKEGAGPVRTGVTAILPRGKSSYGDPVFAGWFRLNGNGEMTGTTWVEEGGLLAGPVMITNTHSVGVVRDAVIDWLKQNDLLKQGNYPWALPVVAETWDGALNDLNGFHVRPEHVFAALSSAASGPVTEGNVGGGTGMICYQFKGGTGTSSRVLESRYGAYTVGVLVQCNCGGFDELRVAGVPVGREIKRIKVWGNLQSPARDAAMGSIIIVVATDAPLLPTQLNRMARRAAIGLARTGTAVSDGDGDIFIAFSTANAGVAENAGFDAPFSLRNAEMVPNDYVDPLFSATVEATEEAIVNAMVAARDMTLLDGRTLIALPHDQLRALLKKYGRLPH
ncbi:MAG TPA: P1 family peptidase [Steroidobacteraceae bacterium]|nr:P1 family peptidase [Steroidobacteraceae bacterium]